MTPSPEQPQGLAKPDSCGNPYTQPRFTSLVVAHERTIVRPGTSQPQRSPAEESPPIHITIAALLPNPKRERGKALTYPEARARKNTYPTRSASEEKHLPNPKRERGKALRKRDAPVPTSRDGQFARFCGSMDLQIRGRFSGKPRAWRPMLRLNATSELALRSTKEFTHLNLRTTPTTSQPDRWPALARVRSDRS